MLTTLSMVVLSLSYAKVIYSLFKLHSMKIKFTILYIFAFFVFSLKCYGQQYPLFSHYTLNSYAFNPAIAGTQEKLILNGTYRTQWVGLTGHPETSILSGHVKLKKLPIGIGGMVYRDKAGKIGRIGASASLSFVQRIGEYAKISVGLSTGYEKIRLENLISDMEDTDPLLKNGSQGVSTPNYSAGVMLQYKGLYVGFSVPQIFHTNINYSENNAENTLTRHYYAMAGYRMPINSVFSIEPSVLVKNVEAAPLQYDATLRIFYKNSFWIGGSYRSEAALVGLVGFNLKNEMSIAYAYDLATTKIKNVNNGTHEVTIGLVIGKKRDNDGDGVPDDEDDCPDEPGDIANNGCPEVAPLALEEDIEEDDLDDPLADTDKDGVLNKDDKCPEEIGLIKNDGCPLGDRDKDGIRDDVDKCPSQFGLAGNNGCPLEDRDNDGIVDNMDKCPDQAGTFAGQGCPSEDADMDGVVDAVDPCPKTPGQNGSGCPQVSKADREILDLAIRNLYFDYDKDEIRATAYQYLDGLAELMVKHPEYKVRLKGFADERGTSAYNIDLSKRRVEAAFFYLTNRGVSKSQIALEYYGEALPDDMRPTEAGYQLNRRVEMSFFFD